MSIIESNVFLSASYALEVKDRVGALTEIPYLFNVEKDNTPVCYSCSSLYTEGKEALQEYLELAGKDSDHIAEIGVTFNELDEQIANGTLSGGIMNG